MQIRVLAVSAIIGFASAGTCSAEDLIQIYDLAVESDPVLREAEQTLYSTREVRPQVRSLLLPNFGLQADAQYQNDKTDGFSLSGSGRRNDTYSSSGVTAAVTQTVYNRGDWISLRQTDDTIAQAEAQYRDSQIGLMVRTTERYFDVLRAAALINAKNLLDNAWEALRRIVGPISVPLARLGAKLPLTPPAPNDIDQWVKTALDNNYGIVAAREAVGSAKKQIEIERSGHYPTVELQAGYDVARTGAEFGSDRDTAFVALNLNLPIYQGGLITSRTRQAGYDLGASQERLDQQRRLVVNNVKDAFRGVISSISDVQARQAAIVSARSALESTQAGLEVGTRTQVDVLNAQRNLFQAEFEYLSARYAYIINGVLLHQATSTLSREVLAKGNAWLNPDDLVPPPSY